ncbi:hypothetical protein Tco_0146391 [Tanacetum coccineum]
MVAYLLKPEGSEDFQQIVDFLNTSHIKFALTENPTIYTSLIQQFWQTASTSTLEDGEVEITATIDGQLKTITEASLRRHLKLEDADGISSLPNFEIFEQLALMGPKKTAWEQFSSNIATAIICLATNRTFNFSKMIFEGMVKNLDSRSKFLMYPSVHSLGRDDGSLSLHELMDLCTSLSKRVASLESKLKQTKQTYNAALTKLINRVKKLKQTIKTSQARRRAKVVISDDEEDEKDPSNQGRSLIEELDLDAGISLVPPHAADQGKIDDTQIIKRRQSVENVQTYTRRRREVTTGSGGVSTANRLVSTGDISTTSEMDSIAGVKAKDKGKAIMHESEPPKKIKKRVQSDPTVLRYHTLQNRPFFMAEVRKNMCLYLKNQDDVIAEQAVKESSRTVGGRRKKSLARKRAKETLSEESAKKQKLEDDTEKEELQVYLNIVSEEESLNIESLATKQDVLELYRLVKERFQTASPEEVMEFESAQSNTTAKLPILKLGEYEMWVIRIKQYFQVQDYALWEVIENDEDDGDVMFSEISKKYDDSREEELEEDENAMTGGLGVEYFDIF